MLFSYFVSYSSISLLYILRPWLFLCSFFFLFIYTHFFFVFCFVFIHFSLIHSSSLVFFVFIFFSFSLLPFCLPLLYHSLRLLLLFCPSSVCLYEITFHLIYLSIHCCFPPSIQSISIYSCFSPHYVLVSF